MKQNGHSLNNAKISIIANKKNKNIGIGQKKLVGWALITNSRNLCINFNKFSEKPIKNCHTWLIEQTPSTAPISSACNMTSDKTKWSIYTVNSYLLNLVTSLKTIKRKEYKHILYN